MQKLLFSLLFLLAVAACKKDEPDPLPEIAPILGKWTPVEYFRANGDTVSLTPQAVNVIVFRYDGLILNGNGYTPCCQPDSYILNGKLFEVKPQKAVQADPSCTFVDCYVCQEMKVDQQPDGSLLIEYCGLGATRYVRE